MTSSAELPALMERIRTLAANQQLRVTRHAAEQMVEEAITFDEVLEAIANGFHTGIGG